MSFDQDMVNQHIRRSSEVIFSLTEQSEQIEQIGVLVQRALRDGNMVFTCGNGGSAAEAMHMTEEMIGRYKRDRRPHRAVCLNADPTALTCIANDFGYDAIFSRQIEALGRPGDVLVVFTTSGKSPNVMQALQTARRAGVTTIGMLGKGGGPCAEHCDHALIVSADDTERIQEAHQVVLHLILEAVDEL